MDDFGRAGVPHALRDAGMCLIDAGRDQGHEDHHRQADVDEEGWKHKVEKMPANWINGFDSNQEIANEELYDLKAMPTLYLLDKGKKVLLKDADLDEILLFLQNTKN